MLWKATNRVNRKTVVCRYHQQKSVKTLDRGTQLLIVGNVVLSFLFHNIHSNGVFIAYLKSIPTIGLTFITHVQGIVWNCAIYNNSLCLSQIWLQTMLPRTVSSAGSTCLYLEGISWLVIFCMTLLDTSEFWNNRTRALWAMPMHSSALYNFFVLSNNPL